MKPSVFTQVFDAIAIRAFPSIARMFGYTFHIGTDPRLASDAPHLLKTLWAAKNVRIPEDLHWVG